MSYTVVIPPGQAGPDNPAWHEARRAGVSASEIAAVLGISPWESAFSLYWRKVNGWEVEGNEEMSTGRYCEAAIADWAGDVIDPNENLVLAPAGLYRSAERPWQLATPDRLVVEPCDLCEGRAWWSASSPCRRCGGTGTGGRVLAVLDCKWTARWDGWGDPETDDIPVYYRAQLLWQCDVLGVDTWFLPMLGPGGFRLYRGRRDEADLAVMRAEGAEFARRLAEQDPPDLDSHTATVGTLKRLHPDVDVDGEATIPADLAAEYDAARAALNEAEARKKLAEARIREALGAAKHAVLPGGEKVAYRSVYTQRRVDVDALRADHPEIADKLTVVSAVDKLMPAARKKAKP